MRKCVSLVAIAAAAVSLGLSGCGQSQQPATESFPKGVLMVPGKWILESDQTVMEDPQTSGLAHWRGKLVSISDGSGKEHQQRRIHIVDPATAQLAPPAKEMTMSSRIRRSCFAQYLADEPDLEAIVVDPNDDSVFYTVTEDATRTGALSESCQRKYGETGSTDYPTLIVRVKRQESGEAQMTHARPLQYSQDFGVGDFPNDGIEGLAMSESGTLYLGLEKDANGQPRIFTLQLSEGFWLESGFAKVSDPKLKTPTFEAGNHPINALEYYFDANQQKGYLLAAARNDNQLWVIDTQKVTDTKVIDMQFTAPTNSNDCDTDEVMDNASIEGIAVIGDTLWLVNDPWKKNYLKNIRCPSNELRYKAMAPLLYSTPLQADWFE